MFKKMCVVSLRKTKNFCSLIHQAIHDSSFSALKLMYYLFSIFIRDYSVYV